MAIGAVLAAGAATTAWVVSSRVARHAALAAPLAGARRQGTEMVLGQPYSPEGLAARGSITTST